MNHTPESLLALTKSPEGLEQLWMIAAEFDGWINDVDGWWNGTREMAGTRLRKPPPYPTSLDAIFAAEERLGLHDRSNHSLTETWSDFMEVVIRTFYGPLIYTADVGFLPPSLRLIIYILTAQWKEQNP